MSILLCRLSSNMWGASLTMSLKSRRQTQLPCVNVTRVLLTSLSASIESGKGPWWVIFSNHFAIVIDNLSPGSETEDGSMKNKKQIAQFSRYNWTQFCFDYFQWPFHLFLFYFNKHCDLALLHGSFHQGSSLRMCKCMHIPHFWAQTPTLLLDSPLTLWTLL